MIPAITFNANNIFTPMIIRHYISILDYYDLSELSKEMFFKLKTIETWQKENNYDMPNGI